MAIEPGSIKAVIFDWGGTCCKEAELFSSKILQKRLGRAPEQITEEIGELYLDYYRGSFTGEIFWKSILRHFGIAEDEVSISDLLSAYLASYCVFPEVLEVAAALKTRYAVGLLSNLTPEMRDHVRAAHRLERCFSVQVYSCDPDVRMLKPSEQPYLIAASKLRVQPRECLFIDNAAANVESARRVGMQGLLFRDVAQFLTEIRPLLER